MANWREVLETTDTVGSEFVPGALFFLGIGTYSSSVEWEWKAPDGTWVNLRSFTEVGQWKLNAAPDSTYRLTTSSAGSQAWVIL